MFKQLLIGIFTVSVIAISWSEANAGCFRIGGTCVSWGGGSGGEIALIEISHTGNTQAQACTIVSGVPPGEGCPEGQCPLEGGGCTTDCPIEINSVGTLQVGVVAAIRARAFGTVGSNCGFGNNEACDFRGLICCSGTNGGGGGGDGDDDDDDNAGTGNCRTGNFPGPVFAEIVGGPGQIDGSEFSFTALRLQPNELEQQQLCELQNRGTFISATAERFFGEVCVEGDSEECIRQFCTGSPTPEGLIVYRCRELAVTNGA